MYLKQITAAEYGVLFRGLYIINHIVMCSVVPKTKCMAIS